MWSGTYKPILLVLPAKLFAERPYSEDYGSAEEVAPDTALPPLQHLLKVEPDERPARAKHRVSAESGFLLFYTRSTGLKRATGSNRCGKYMRKQ